MGKARERRSCGHSLELVLGWYWKMTGSYNKVTSPTFTKLEDGRLVAVDPPNAIREAIPRGNCT